MGKLSLPRLLKVCVFIAHDWRIMIFIVSKDSPAKQITSTSETDLVESLKSLVFVAKRAPTEEKQDDVLESDANENAEGYLKWL